MNLLSFRFQGWFSLEYSPMLWIIFMGCTTRDIFLVSTYVMKARIRSSVRPSWHEIDVFLTSLNFTLLLTCIHHLYFIMENPFNTLHFVLNFCNQQFSSLLLEKEQKVPYFYWENISRHVNKWWWKALVSFLGKSWDTQGYPPVTFPARLLCKLN